MSTTQDTSNTTQTTNNTEPEQVANLPKKMNHKTLSKMKKQFNEENKAQIVANNMALAVAEAALAAAEAKAKLDAVKAELDAAEAQAKLDAVKAALAAAEAQAKLDAVKAELDAVKAKAELDAAKAALVFVNHPVQDGASNNTKPTPAIGSPEWNQHQVNGNEFPDLHSTKSEEPNNTYVRPDKIVLHKPTTPQGPLVQQPCYDCSQLEALRNGRCRGCTIPCTDGKKCDYKNCRFRHNKGDNYFKVYVTKCKNCASGTFGGHPLCSPCSKKNKNVQVPKCENCPSGTFDGHPLCSPCFKKKNNVRCTECGNITWGKNLQCTPCYKGL